MSKTIVCTAADFDRFWLETFGEFADDLYVDDGGPSEEEWVGGSSDPNMVWEWSGGWIGWQGGESRLDGLSAEDRVRVQGWLKADLSVLFESWQQSGAARVQVTVSLPTDPAVLAGLDRFLAEHGGSR